MNAHALKKYRITEMIPTDGPVKQSVAVKISSKQRVHMYHWALDSPMSRLSFTNEIEVAQVLRNKKKYLSGAIAWAESGNLGTLVYPYLSLSLFQHIKKHAPHGLNAATLRLVFGRICLGLHVLHKSSVAHLDLNPENLLFDEEPEQVCIAHYGCAFRSHMPSGLTTDRTTLQTVTNLGRRGEKRYCAPEVFESPDCYDPYRADMYSLGVVLHFLATGRRPHVTEAPYGQAPLLDLEAYQRAFPCREAFDLMVSLLARSPEQRPVITEVLADDWLRELSPKKTKKSLFKR